MKKIFTALAFVLLVSACGGGGGGKPPKNLDNACSIVSQRASWHKDMKSVQRKWGIPVHVQMATIHQESKFVGDARTPFRYVLGVIPMGRQSSAYGYSQALDATWKEYKNGPGRSGAKRDDIGDATDFMGWYMNLTLERNNIALTDTRNQYLNYHEGHTGYARGSHNSKPWLLEVATRVEQRAEQYQLQLRSC